MKNFLTVLLLILIAVLAPSRLCAAAIPTGAQFIGEFPVGQVCYQFSSEHGPCYVVLCGGTLATGILFRIISSPDNMDFPTSYCWLVRDGRNGFAAWRKNGITIYVVPIAENGYRVWVMVHE